MSTETSSTSKYKTDMTDAELEKWRFIQDEEADAVAEKLVSHPHFFHVYTALNKINKNNDIVDESLFDEFRKATDVIDDEHKEIEQTLLEYFNNTEHFNLTEKERETWHSGCDFYGAHGTCATITLAVRSLLKQYAAANATNVLVSTQLLTKYPHRRVLSTMQFVLDVMDPDGLDPDGGAIRSIQKLRLVHAMIRARIKLGKTGENEGLNPTVKWTAANEKKWGKPINQQDMIFAVHTFSVEVINGLLKAGFTPSKKEIEDYYYTWHLIGRALGVKDEINPTTYKEGMALQNRIYAKQFKLDDNLNGPILADPLITFMDQLLPFADRDDIYAMVYYFNDEHDHELIEKALEVPLKAYDRHFYGLLKDALSAGADVKDHAFKSRVGHEEKHCFLDDLANQNLDIIENLVDMSKTWKGHDFQLSDGWGRRASKKDQTTQTSFAFNNPINTAAKWASFATFSAVGWAKTFMTGGSTEEDDDSMA